MSDDFIFTGGLNPMTNKITNKLDKLFTELDDSLDYAEYAALERRDPRLAERLARLVEAGATAKQIVMHVIDGRPHKWIEAQALGAAARYLEDQVNG